MSESKVDLPKNNVLLGCTGSVATVKIPKIVEGLKSSKYKINIQVVPTESSLHFFNPADLGVEVYRDRNEWETWQKMGDSVLHIELRKWADVMVIAPLDANTLAKLANGLCDNLLTCTVRAWDLERPLLFAPAMNTFMWKHPLTSKQVTTLKEFGYTEIPVVEKLLACGDKGTGGMAEASTIVETTIKALETLNGIV